MQHCCKNKYCVLPLRHEHKTKSVLHSFFYDKSLGISNHTYLVYIIRKKINF